ncbi:hypothetical protein [Sphaerotilus mobilis]|uniref:Outer membrane protein with beta-barrel domain n=1 Tax=Sphaerotilus mobilis TaxID=47994 RepID=A0A4Q7LQI5_9BURK|nr:hypothetical protein [Sphaerotilus mobilis]RZS57126.1 hypothetical protein EV685_1690 [Sphaerotilus mobilis]
MKKPFFFHFAALISIATICSTAHTQTILRPIAAVGLNGGGDQFSPSVPGGNRYQPARVSGLVHAYIGAEYLPSSSYGISATIGFQGGVLQNKGQRRYEFARIPVELQISTELLDGIGIIGGVRKSLSPSVKMPASEQQYEPKLSSDIGYFGGIRFGFGQASSIMARYTIEKFNAPGIPPINGRHFGIYYEFAR